MRSAIRIVGLALAGGALAGCTTALPPEKVEAIGPPFNEELKQGYVQLAAAESGGMLFRNSHFYGKARNAMLGDDVWPDKVGSRDIAPELRPEALELRARLVAALEGNARMNVPAEAATAQTSFDCWLDEIEDQPGSDAAEACRQGFLVALAAAEAATAMAELPPAYEVFFTTGRSDLDQTAVATIEEAARGAGLARAERVEVIGYTDRSGDPATNERLARRRAEAVAAALSQAGVPRQIIEVRSGGAIGTRDDRSSRRVEIVVGS